MLKKTQKDKKRTTNAVQNRNSIKKTKPHQQKKYEEDSVDSNKEAEEKFQAFEKHVSVVTSNIYLNAYDPIEKQVRDQAAK